MYPEEEEYGRISEATGEYARLEKLDGHLLLIYPIGYIEHSPTRFSTPGKRSDVIVSDIIDLDDKDEQGNFGKVYRNTWWRGAQLIIGLRPQIGRKVLGRLGRGVARNGMNAPWVVNDMTADEGCLTQARAWRREHQAFTPNTFQAPAETPLPPVPQPAPQSRFGPMYQDQAAPPQDRGYTGGGGPSYPLPDYGNGPQVGAAAQNWPQIGAATQQSYPPASSVPRYPVEQTPLTQADADMLELMRLRRQQREQPDNPPF